MSSREHLQRISTQAKADQAHLNNYLDRLMEEDGISVEDRADLVDYLINLEETTNLLLERLS